VVVGEDVVAIAEAAEVGGLVGAPDPATLGMVDDEVPGAQPDVGDLGRLGLAVGVAAELTPALKDLRGDGVEFLLEVP